MARYSIQTTKTSGAAAAWLAQFRTGSARDARVFEVGVFTTTAVAGTVGLIRSATVGATFTSTATGAPYDPVSAAGVAVIDTAATTAPTISGTPAYFKQAVFPATAGSGVIWSFPNGLIVPISSGLLLWQLSTAAVGYNFYVDFEE
jgi:hypothetical protein